MGNKPSVKPSERAIKFIESYCTHTVGSDAGKPFILEEWQKDLLRKFFDTLDENGQRVYQQVYLELGRKNGKSSLVACLGLFALLADGGQASVVSAASDRQQARAIFDTAKAMVLNSPVLSKRCKVMQSEIKVPSTNSSYRVISADAKRQHGLNPSFVILDELHCLHNDELYTALRTAGGARRNFSFWQITTAGNFGSFAWQQHQYASKVRDGVIKDKTFLPVIYAADPAGDWTSEEQWKKANPNYGVSILPKFMHDLCNEAKSSVEKEINFKRFHLNLWPGAGFGPVWIPMDKWDRLEKHPRQELMERLEGRIAYGGLDLSSKRDMTAFSLYFPPTYDEHHAGYFLNWHWVPNYPADFAERIFAAAPMLKDWISKGFIRQQETPWINQSEIVSDIVESCSKFQVHSIGVDEWNHGDVIGKLQKDHGIETLAWRPTPRNCNFPMKELETFIQHNRVVVQEDPVLRWQISNVVCTSDKFGNIGIDKSREREKIDAVYAMIVALGRFLAVGSDADYSFMNEGITIL